MPSLPSVLPPAGPQDEPALVCAGADCDVCTVRCVLRSNQESVITE